MSNETGVCKKCTSDIPLEAERCPQCGYEPGKGVLGPIGKIIGFLLMIGAVFQILIGLLLLLTPFAGAPISSALTGAGIFSVAGLIQGAIANWIGKFGTYYAAEQPDETPDNKESKSVKEEMQEAYQQGKERRERRNERIDQLSPWVFTSTIIAGAGFVFLTFVIIGAEIEIVGVPPEDLFMIPFIMSMIVLAFTVLADVGRVNRLYNTDHKWWVWVFSSIIPFIGFIPALAWVWQRRKTEQANQGQSQPETPTEVVN